MEAIETRKSRFISVIREKCPHCGKAHVFKKGGSLFKMPEMNEYCESCHYHFDREPGYFLGAMYISYGIAVAAAIATFLVCHFLFPQMPTVLIPVLIGFVILLIARKNYKISRVLYIHLFPW